MLIQLWGALVPTGYQLDKTIPNRPWVCPVRTCRQAFAKPNDFGFHFEVRPAMSGKESLVALWLTDPPLACPLRRASE